MKIRAYSPRTGNLLQDDITGINYGNIQKGKHGALPVVIRPLKTTEDKFLDEIKLFLQNNGGYNQSQFGYLLSDQFVANVRSYTSDSVLSDGVYISDHFTLNPLATGVDGISVSIEDGNEDYIWLDVQVGALETGSTTNVNYRFTFEYS